jgi:hypothetical protein
MSAFESNEWDDGIGAAFGEMNEALGGGLSEREISAGAGAITLIDKDLAQLWWDRVDLSGTIPVVAKWRLQDFIGSGKQPGGPKPLISDAVILTIALILVMEGQTVRVLDMKRALESRLTPGAREVLGISHLYDGSYRNWYFLAHRAVHRLIATWDAWVANDGHKRNNWKGMTLQEREAWEEKQDPAFVDMMRARGDWFMNALIDMSLKQQSRRFRRRKTAISLDQTAVQAGVQQARWKRDKATKKEVPMGNLYTGKEESRRVLANEVDWVPKEKGAKKRDADAENKKTVSHLRWVQAYMANVAIDVVEDPRADKTTPPPQLIRAISLGTPNKRIAEHTIDLMDSLLSRGYDITRLTFDRGYSQLSDKFHEALIARGIPVVKDYVQRQKGVAEDSIGGALMVDGRYVCPSTPQHLLTSTERYDRAEITVEEFQDEKGQLGKYELGVRDRKDDGTLRLSCPATGLSPSASCPLRQLHRKAVPDEEADRVRIYKRDMTDLQKEYKVCCQGSITVKPTAHVQQRQKYRFGGKVWTKTYRADRNSIESTNDLLQKDMKLEQTANRPMRGLAAQQFAFALIAVASNMRRITKHEHELYVEEKRAAAGRAPKPRRPQKDRLQRSRDRLGETRYMKNPPPRKLVPLDELVTPPPAPPPRKPR